MFDERTETMGREVLAGVQTKRLRLLMDRLMAAPEASRRYRDVGVTAGSEIDLESLGSLPFMTKSDMVSRYPMGGLLVDEHEVVEWHGSSGTGGRETLVPYTRRDIKNWSEACARLLSAAGITERSVVVNAYSLGLFSGGLGYHYALQRLGAAVVPLGVGPVPRLIRLLRDMHVDTLACTPTYAARLAEHVSDADDFALRNGIFGAEPFSDEMRNSLERRLGLRAVDVYGLSEASGPGVAGECLQRDGLHVNEDHFLVEIVDPASGRACDDGTVGEIVLTTLSKEAGPVLRYRTGDLASLRRDPCACGRTFARISRVRARLDDMLVVNGVNVFPRDIEQQIVGLPELSGDFAVLLVRRGGSDATVVIEMRSTSRARISEIESGLAARLGVRLRVEPVVLGSLRIGEVKRGRRVVPADSPDAVVITQLLARS